MAKLYELLLTVLRYFGIAALILGILSEWGQKLIREITASLNASPVMA